MTEQEPAEKTVELFIIRIVEKEILMTIFRRKEKIK
jgi:predicted transcriptional regulator